MITILGASGFLGSHMELKCKNENIPYWSPARQDKLEGKKLGHVLYCIGLTSDFRTKPFDTVEAHVCKLNEVLKHCDFDSLTYLSSTRVYINSINEFAAETDKLIIDPLNPDDLYNLTKLTGERLCLSSGRNTKVVRLSNIVGNDIHSENFLPTILKQIKINKTLDLGISLSSAKDYLFIDDAIHILYKIMTAGKEKIYNLGSGINTSNKELMDEIKRYIEFTYTENQNAKEIIFPRISVDRIKKEFNHSPTSINTYIPQLLQQIN